MGTWIIVLTSEPAVLDIILKLVTMSEETIKHRLGFNNCEILLQHQTIRDIDIIILYQIPISFLTEVVMIKLRPSGTLRSSFSLTLNKTAIHTSSFGAHDR